MVPRAAPLAVLAPFVWMESRRYVSQVPTRQPVLLVALHVPQASTPSRTGQRVARLAQPDSTVWEVYKWSAVQAATRLQVHPAA